MSATTNLDFSAYCVGGAWDGQVVRCSEYKSGISTQESEGNEKPYQQTCIFLPVRDGMPLFHLGNDRTEDVYLRDKRDGVAVYMIEPIGMRGETSDLYFLRDVELSRRDALGIVFASYAARYALSSVRIV